jgi:hypothetical protein
MLKYLKNRFAGKRCFIVGNGPSLNKTDMSLLRGEYTFCFNRSYIAYDDWGFIPTFYACIDRVVLPDNAEEINRLIADRRFAQTQFFFPSWSRPILRNEKHVHFVEVYESGVTFDENGKRLGLLRNVGATMIQAAFYLGFEQIVLVGCDASYVERPADVEEDKSETGRVGWTAYKSTADTDPNHFHPNYFGKGKKYSVPNLSAHLKGWLAVKDWVDAYNNLNPRTIQVVDATVDGKLTYFEKYKLEDIIAGKVPVKPPAGIPDERESVIVFGTGKAARDFLKARSSEYFIDHFVDNNESRWWEYLCGRRIENADGLRYSTKKYDIVIAVQNGLTVLEHQLKDMGVYDRSRYYMDYLKGDA